MSTEDDRISAWLDGMLDEDGAAGMTELAAKDANVAHRVARMRHIDDLVRAAVPAEDDVSPALLERLGLGPAAGESGAAATAADVAAQETVVVDFAAARAARDQRPTSPVRRFAGWKIAAQIALVAGIGIVMLQVVRPGAEFPGREDHAVPADYRVLGDAAQPGAAQVNALVMFAPGTAPDVAYRIAQDAGARLVGPQNGAGAWKAAIEPARRDAVLHRLASDTRVTLAEPVDGPTP